jgi:RNA polymerase sigma-70 factor, ECF subfamily
MDQPNRETSDGCLLERVRAGDLDAFADLVRLHRLGVRVFIGAHVRDASARDDLVQDVFLRALQGLSSLRDPGAFRSWLLGIAHNRTLEYIRERLRVTALDEATFETLLDRGQLALLEGEDDDARRGIELEALRECLRQLPPAGGRLLREHYFKGRPIAYLAEQERKREGAVRVMLFRLREMLRDCVRSRTAAWSQP